MENTHDYLTLETCAEELKLKARMVRILCERYAWFGGKLGGVAAGPIAPWVITRAELDRMKLVDRPRPGPRPRRPIGDQVEV